MTIERKEREPRIVKATTIPRPPIRPLGTRYEFWGRVVGIDRALMIYDLDSAVGFPHEIPAKDRQVIARYMIALWKRFEAGK